jgi:hypothetical protein
MSQEVSMSSSAMAISEMLITLGVCLCFGFYQLWDLKRENAKAIAKKAENSRDGAAS